MGPPEPAWSAELGPTRAGPPTDCARAPGNVGATREADPGFTSQPNAEGSQLPMPLVVRRDAAPKVGRRLLWGVLSSPVPPVMETVWRIPNAPPARRGPTSAGPVRGPRRQVG